MIREQIIGAFIIAKYREQRKVSGMWQAARNMRKQGYPLWLALLALSDSPIIDILNRSEQQ